MKFIPALYALLWASSGFAAQEITLSPGTSALIEAQSPTTVTCSKGNLRPVRLCTIMFSKDELSALVVQSVRSYSTYPPHYVDINNVTIAKFEGNNAQLAALEFIEKAKKVGICE